MDKVKEWIAEHSSCDICKGFVPDLSPHHSGIICCSPECEKEMREVMEALANEAEKVNQCKCKKKGYCKWCQ